jgi:hypothetical protein
MLPALSNAVVTALNVVQPPQCGHLSAFFATVPWQCLHVIVLAIR